MARAIDYWKLSMKFRALLCLATALACVLPAGAADANPRNTASASGPSAMPPAPWRLAQAATSTAPAQATTDAEPAAPRKAATAKQRRRKKPTEQQQPERKSGAAIVKEGGQTCSGLDQYRVCW
jgi:hypothetical protein